MLIWVYQQECTKEKGMTMTRRSRRTPRMEELEWVRELKMEVDEHN